MHKEIDGLLHFLDAAPTAWHAVDSLSKKLIEEGFQQLHEKDRWTVQPEGRYFIIRNGSSICAFVMPKKLEAIRLVLTHTDSPRLKLKPKPEFIRENMLMLGAEVYGAPLLSSWLNRDLGIAGRVLHADAHGQVNETLVCLDDHPVVLPQLAIHLDRQVNQNGVVLNQQDHLAVLAGTSSLGYLDRSLKKKYGFYAILASDLMLYPLQKAALAGEHHELISAYRLDNLASVFASFSALCQAKASHAHTLKMAVAFDNEEIGSSTAQGAESPFISHVLERIALSQKMDREDYLRLLPNSLCVSTDLAHAMHPNYSDRHEPRHVVLLNRGIAIKFNAQHKYATDARSAGALIALCKKHQIQFQEFVARADIPCGSTVGPIHAHNTGMPTVDIGCPQLSMHSCRELIGCHDQLEMTKLLKAVFE